MVLAVVEQLHQVHLSRYAGLAFEVEEKENIDLLWFAGDGVVTDGYHRLFFYRVVVESVYSAVPGILSYEDDSDVAFTLQLDYFGLGF